jgi:hypothetical protein
VGESEAKLLRRGTRELHAAHERGDTERAEQLANALAVHVGQFFEERETRRQHGERTTGFEGLLLEQLWGER